MENKERKLSERHYQGRADSPYPEQSKKQDRREVKAENEVKINLNDPQVKMALEGRDCGAGAMIDELYQ